MACFWKHRNDYLRQVQNRKSRRLAILRRVWRTAATQRATAPYQPPSEYQPPSSNYQRPGENGNHAPSQGRIPSLRGRRVSAGLSFSAIRVAAQTARAAGYRKRPLERKTVYVE